jgi:hypothetical protein
MLLVESFMNVWKCRLSLTRYICLYQSPTVLPAARSMHWYMLPLKCSKYFKTIWV